MSIEELAFKDRKILANLNAIDLLDIIEFLQEDRNQWINQFTKTHNEGVEIQKENQGLKEALEAKSYCKYANKCDELDDCSREEYEDMANANMRLNVENQKLKSQLAGTTHCFDEEEHRKLKDEIKELEKIIELCHLDAEETLATINYEQDSQQKKFINYLQKEINRYNAHIDAVNSVGVSVYSTDYDNSKLKLAIFKEVLLKYIEITQTKNDNSVRIERKGDKMSAMEEK